MLRSTKCLKERIQNKLHAIFKQKNINLLLENYFTAIPTSYLNGTSEERICKDLCVISTLTKENHVAIDIEHLNCEEDDSLHLRLFQFNYLTALADILPILDNLGFRAIREQSYGMELENGSAVYFSDYIVSIKVPIQNIIQFNKIICESLIQILNNAYENDGLNRLIMNIGCSCREVMVFRSYVKYMQQIQVGFNQQYLELILNNNADLSKLLLEFFIFKHKPGLESRVDAEQLSVLIRSRLDEIQNSNEAKVLKRYFNLMESTIRTNYFQTDSSGRYRSYLSLKFKSSQIIELPDPKPLYELYVYSSAFQGILIKTAKIARSVIRWSNRCEDYRSEILSLIDIQVIKNAGITPFYANGKFVIHASPNNLSKSELENEIIAAYQLFIRGLLDLSDNLINKVPTHPQHVVCYDDYDAFLLISSGNKNTIFADLANNISNEYGFWLGDTFATNGASGIDYVKFGVGAKGMWESIKRHFKDLGFNLDSYSPRIVSIGNMNEHTFGQSMIYSDKISIVAAFDKEHIFIDPFPDPKNSYLERYRLVNTHNNSWGNYDPELISNGGGVYSRSVNMITLTEETRTLLNITEKLLSPEELIKKILKSQVDLIYIGETGTYIKEKSEDNADMNDRINDAIRINSDELHCRALIESGHSGVTPRARIEYSLAGGLINIGLIDNAAAIYCTDQEVNIKIAFINKILKKELSLKQRNEWISKASGEIEMLALKESHSQALVMSFSAVHSIQYIDLYQAQLKKLKSIFDLSKLKDYLPDNKSLLERKSSGKGFTRPELAILLAYSKIHAKNEILKSNMTNAPFINKIINTAFPDGLHAILGTEITHHYLAKEIIATQLSNTVINRMGISYLYRLNTETGEPIPEIMKSFLVSMEIFNLKTLYDEIESLDNSLSSEMQYELLHQIRRLINMSSRWFLKSNRLMEDIDDLVNYYKTSVEQLTPIIPKLIVGQTKKLLELNDERFISSGLSRESANKLSILRVLYTALNISEVAKTHSFDIGKTAKVYFCIGGHFNLVWFRDLIANDNEEGYKNSMARLILRDDIDHLQRRLTILMMQSRIAYHDESELVQRWIEIHKNIFTRWDEVVTFAQNANYSDYTVFFVALRELSSMLDSKFPYEKFQQLAMRDPLTNLPNRNVLHFEFDNFVKSTVNNNSMFALAFIDVDKFKSINDNYGHDIGDLVLKVITDRVQKCIRSTDLFVRNGGDEFVLIVNIASHKNEILTVLERINEQFIPALPIKANCEIPIKLSIGISFYPSDGITLDALIKKADMEMYLSKQNKEVHNNFTNIYVACLDYQVQL